MLSISRVAPTNAATATKAPLPTFPTGSRLQDRQFQNNQASLNFPCQVLPDPQPAVFPQSVGRLPTFFSLASATDAKPAPLFSAANRDRHSVNSWPIRPAHAQSGMPQSPPESSGRAPSAG